MLFTTLFPLLKDPCDSITITIVRESDTAARVNLIPKLKHPNSETEEGLRTPVSLVATPAELDSPAFLEVVSRFTASATGLVAAGAAIEAEHKASAAKAKTPTKGKPGIKPPVKSSLPAKASAPSEEAEEPTATETGDAGLGL